MIHVTVVMTLLVFALLCFLETPMLAKWFEKSASSWEVKPDLKTHMRRSMWMYIVLAICFLFYALHFFLNSVLMVVLGVALLLGFVAYSQTTALHKGWIIQEHRTKFKWIAITWTILFGAAIVAVGILLTIFIVNGNLI